MKYPDNPLNVEITDIQGGYKVDVKIPEETGSLVIIDVIEGLLTGMCNVFGISKIKKTRELQDGVFLSASWNLFELE